MNNSFLFTNAGLEKLKKELNQLVEKELPRLIDRVAVARSHGDLSENSEYTAAREDLSFIEGRIEELEEIVAKAKVIKSTKPNNQVQLGSKITVKVNGATHIYTLVGEWESDPMEKKISNTSPLGQALLGKKKGEIIEIEAPAGKVKYHIEDIN